MRKQNLLLSAFAILLLFSPAAFAANDNAGSGEQATQNREERRGPPPGHRGHGPQLTDAQRSCLEGILGRPGEGERPSHEKMHAAMESCGVPKPPHGGRPPHSVENSSEGSDQAEE